MARPYRLKAVEREKGVSIDILIPRLVNELGSQHAAAAALGVSQYTISEWLRANGYRPKTVYVRETGEQAS